MTTQPEALRLAQALESQTTLIDYDRKKSAAELRRLHEVHMQWQEKCNTYIEIHDAVVKDNERLHEVNAELVEALLAIQATGRHALFVATGEQP